MIFLKSRYYILYLHNNIYSINVHRSLRSTLETVLLSHSTAPDAGVTDKYSVHGDLLIVVVKVISGQYVEPDVLVSYVNGKILRSWIIVCVKCTVIRSGKKEI